MFKVKLSDLKKAVQWIEANTHNEDVTVMMVDNRNLVFKCFDRNDSEVEITIFGGGELMAKIKKTEVL